MDSKIIMKRKDQVMCELNPHPYAVYYIEFYVYGCANVKSILSFFFNKIPIYTSYK